MGCSTSLAMVAKTKQLPVAEEGDIFTERQKIVVRRTWKYLANDLTGHGSKVFLYIFKTHPHVKQLFPCRDCEGEELLKNSNFKGHASRFMQAVGAVVDNVDNPERALAPLLIGLGKQHIHFMGFEPHYFDAFTDAMMHVWAEELGHRFNEDVANAWRKVFEFIMSKLKEGYQIAVTEEQKASQLTCTTRS